MEKNSNTRRSVGIYKSNYGRELIPVIYFEPGEVDGFAEIYSSSSGGSKVSTVPFSAIEKVSESKVHQVGTNLMYFSGS